MIKQFSLVLFVCLSLSACATSPEPVPVTTEQPEAAQEPLTGIDAYREMSGKFFYFDEQDFQSVTCSIEVPKLTEILEKTRTQLAASGYTASIVENMSGFSITYSPSSGTSFTSPEVKVMVSRVEGVAPPERLKDGAKKFEEGFAIQIISVQNQIKGLLDLMSVPEMEDISGISITREDGRTVFAYMREGIHVEEIFTDNVREIRSETDNVQLFMRTEYQSVAAGRPVMSAAHIEAKQPVGDVTSDLEIELQDVGNIMFLKRLGVDVTTRGQGIYHQAKFDILLNDCRLHE